MDLPQTGHESVLMDAVLEHLAPLPGKIIVDGTLGRGGHSHEIAKRLGYELRDHAMTLYGHCRKPGCPSARSDQKKNS